MTALLVACSQDHADVVDALLEHPGIEINKPDKVRESISIIPWYVFVRYYASPPFTLLTVIVYLPNWYALHIISMDGRPSCVRLFMDTLIL